MIDFDSDEIVYLGERFCNMGNKVCLLDQYLPIAFAWPTLKYTRNGKSAYIKFLGSNRY